MRETRWRPQPIICSLAVLCGLSGTAPPGADAVPTFARRHEAQCSRCHVVPPKLNEVGERFAAARYELPELPVVETLPVSLWITGRSESRPVTGGRDEISPHVNRVELISGGKLMRPWLSYFVEWRVVSQESRPDGSLRDRSGRLEDAFLVIAPWERFSLAVGQYRQIEQVDVSLRLSLSEPLALSASLPGEGGSSPRRTALRSFSPAGRSPALRVSWSEALGNDWEWTASATLPAPGELSIPLTSEARLEASNEIEWRAKGVVLESFLRRGVTSYGAHLFYDDGDRHLLHGVVTGRRGSFYWTLIAGFDAVQGNRRGRWSAQGEYLPAHRWGVGARLEERTGDGADPAFVPYATYHFPRGPTRFTVTLEQRLQRGGNATLLEAGWVL